MEDIKPIIAISSGDPNGIGYEVILKTIAHPHILEICTPVVYGNLQMAKQHLQFLDEEYHKMQFNLIDDISKAATDKLNFINCHDELPITPGKSNKDAGRASLQALGRACKDIHQGKAHALVTAPINKENIQSEKFHYSGHTEYLTHVFGGGKDSLMMMVSDQMRVALVCNHVALKDVPNYITEDRIIAKLEVLNLTLKNDFSIERPRIAVLSLNPHAGDNGLLGTEEQDIIIPAIKKANEQNIWAFGPYSSDGFFGAGRFMQFDAVLAMYHDQGLAPFKTLDMSGVNFTAGLSIIRTSPDHGTAYELVGKNQANEMSFRNALYMAIDLVATRQANKVLQENKMKEPVVEPTENAAQPISTDTPQTPQE